MAKKKSTQAPSASIEADGVAYKFAVPSFEHNRKVYKSAAVQASAEAGDEEALTVIAELVKIGSGILQVVEKEKGGA